jgi:zinc protease
MKDIDAITLKDARDYFRTYYAPNNAVLALVGDFKTADMIKKVDKAYGDIPAQPAPRKVVNAEPEQEGEVRVVYEREAELPSVLIGYKGVSILSGDDAVLDVLSQILSGGESSRLYRTLVYEKQIATSAWCANESQIDPGLVTFFAQAQPGHTTKECEAAIYEIIADIAKNGVTDRELQTAKNGLRTGWVSMFKTNSGVAERVAHYEAIWGDWKAYTNLPKRRQAVTSKDVQRAAQRYLQASRRTVIELLPKEEPNGR